MKKLLFATAIAASAAAFATDPFNAISFEEYTPGATFDNGDPENNVFPTGNSAMYFYFQGDSNSSVVTNESPVPLGVTRPKYFADNPGTGNGKYLALDTEGGTFWRSINTVISATTGEGSEATTTWSLGTAQAVGDGIYLDTMVQFTVTEDEAPETTAGDKLAIWLQASEGTTNLMVKASTCTFEGALDFQPTTFTIPTSCVNVEAGVWYRLTVKAIKNVITSSSTVIPAFEIRIDGTQLAATTAQIDADFQSMLSAGNAYAAGMETLVSANKLFPYLLTEAYADESDVALQGVGFQGTGAVDDLVLTTEDPFAGVVTTIDFTLAWDSEKVTGVQYTFGDLTTTNSLTSGTAVQLPVGDGTATIELIPTFASGYEFDKVTMGETELGLTFAIPGVTTNATLVAKAAAPAYPDYIDTTDAAIKAKYDAWKAGVGCDDSAASAYLNQFLLNVDEATTVGNTALTITEIKENATAGWDITIGCTVSGASLTGTVGSTIVCNGYLAVSYTDDLAGTWTTENIPVTAVDATTGTVTVNVNKSGAKFMKVTLTAAPQAAAGN